jgi:carbonic anhydrase
LKESIVCRYTECGAKQALLHPEKLQNLPAVKDWWQHAETTVRIVKDLSRIWKEKNYSRPPYGKMWWANLTI